MVRCEVFQGPRSIVLSGESSGTRRVLPQQMLHIRTGRLSSEDLSNAVLPPAQEQRKVLRSDAKQPCMLSKLTGLQHLLLPTMVIV